MTDLAKRIEQPFLDRILFVGGSGDVLPVLRTDVPKCVFMGTPAELIAAVVAVLPKADVSDEAIREAWQEWTEESGTEAVRALLDAQAAAHAAEVGRWKERHESAMAEVKRLNDSLDYANRGKAELEAEVEALRAEVTGIAADRDKAYEESYDLATWLRTAEADRDRAVREALENAAALLDAIADNPGHSTYTQVGHAARDNARIVRSLIPEGDTDV